METSENRRKDGWDKADIILKPVGGLMTAVAIGAVGYFTSNLLNERQAQETNFRLYSELMSQRETAESDLRKDMFSQVIATFVGTEAGLTTLEDRLLNLELLAYNFHESLNLKPLFGSIRKEIEEQRERRGGIGTAEGDQLRRLRKLGREVVGRQLQVLEAAGSSFGRHVSFDSLESAQGGLQLAEDSLEVEGLERHFAITLLDADTANRELRVRLEIITHHHGASGTNGLDDGEAPATFELPVVREFSVGFFDFPMVDNTRLTRNQRCAVVLSQFDDSGAEIQVIYFPGSHATLREKPYFEEVIRRLLAEEEGHV